MFVVRIGVSFAHVHVGVIVPKDRPRWSITGTGMVAIPDSTYLPLVIQRKSLPDVKEKPMVTINSAANGHSVLDREPDLEIITFNKEITEMLEN